MPFSLTNLGQRLSPPWLVWVKVLVVISSVEFALMLILPMFTGPASKMLDASIDSILLTLIISPLLWQTIARPLQQSAAMREQFLAHTFASIEEERRRIAYELHDGVGQSLTLLVSGLRSLPEHVAAPSNSRTDELCRLAQQSLKDIKRIALGLRPSLLDDLGLAAAIERTVNDVRDQSGLSIDVDVAALAGQRYAGPIETALFRIFQEGLTNIVKHAGAKHACVRVTPWPETIEMEIRDDGRGIDPAQFERPDGHLGLVGMRERAVLAGGNLTIDSTPGRGTRLAVQLPLVKA